MSFTDLLINLADVTRKSQDLYSGDVTADLTKSFTITLDDTSYPNVVVNSVSVGGTVSIVGSGSEDIYISEAKMYIGSTGFTSISSLSFSGFRGNVRVYMANSSGTPMYFTSTIYSDMPCRLMIVTEKEASIAPGVINVGDRKIIYDTDYTLELEDIVTIDSVKYAVVRTDSFYDSQDLHHYESILRELKT